MISGLGESGMGAGLQSPLSNKKIWAIGGGKGGVGKSLVTANISICLALMGYKVVPSISTWVEPIFTPV